MADPGKGEDGSKLAGPRAWRPRAMIAGAAILIALSVATYLVHDHQIQTRLVIADPDQVTSDPVLVGYAIHLARPAYAGNCASCHGSEMQGDQAKGAPNLKDQVWLYDTNSVDDIERTLLYGIRSGNGKARNI